MNYRIRKKCANKKINDDCEKFIANLKTTNGNSCCEEYKSYLNQIYAAVEKAYAEYFPIHNFCFVEIDFYDKLIGCELIFSNEKEEIYFFVDEDFKVTVLEAVAFSDSTICTIPRHHCNDAVSSIENKDTKAIMLSEKIEYDNIFAKDTLLNLCNDVCNDEMFNFFYDYEEYPELINMKTLLYEIAQKAISDKFPIEDYFVMGRPIRSFKTETYLVRLCNQKDHNKEIIFLVNHLERAYKRAIPLKRVNGKLQACKTCWGEQRYNNELQN